MNFPSDLRYTAEHEWVALNGNIATVGITDFAQGELGDIVFIELDCQGKSLESQEVFGTVEAVKTGTATPVTGHDGRMAMVIATAAQRSVRLARPVATSEIV
ncbi:MAG: hypothetical protein EB145_05105 [Proteobacteria bacterium]|nr:hypothetical protein [Pseudomonadota bacterium]